MTTNTEHADQPLATAACFVQGPAQSSDEPVDPNSLSDAEIEDLTTLAGELGISVDAAIQQFGWHPTFSAIVDQIQAAYPDEFAGAGMEPTEQYVAWVRFVGTPPVDALNTLNSYPRRVSVSSHCGVSEAALTARLEEVHYSVYARQDLVADVSSGYDIDSGVVTVVAEPVAATDAEGRAQIQGQLVAELPPGPPDIPVDVQVVNEVEVGDDATIYGGRALSSCTTGFNVRRSSDGLSGTTTAGHCGDSQNYSGLALSLKGQHVGRFGDLQWHIRTGESFPDDFDSGGGIRDVGSVRVAANGQYLCRNGKSTGRRCDVVYQRAHCANSACGLVAMAHRRAAGGDSGGPWYNGGSAYGIHMGSKLWKGLRRDLYTPVVYLPNALGVSVKTSP